MAPFSAFAVSFPSVFVSMERMELTVTVLPLTLKSPRSVDARAISWSAVRLSIFSFVERSITCPFSLCPMPLTYLPFSVLPPSAVRVTFCPVTCAVSFCVVWVSVMPSLMLPPEKVTRRSCADFAEPTRTSFFSSAVRYLSAVRSFSVSAALP